MCLSSFLTIFIRFLYLYDPKKELKYRVAPLSVLKCLAFCTKDFPNSFCTPTLKPQIKPSVCT